MARTRRTPRRPARSPSARGAARPRVRIDWTAVALVAVAVAIRLPHLGWGLPEVEEEAMPMKQALAMWGWETGRVTLDPGRADWPSLSFYLQLVLQHLHYLVGRVVGVFANRDDYFLSYWLDNGPVLLLARASAVAATAGIVWCGYGLARRLAGLEAGILVGGLLALCPMLVEYAQLVTPDVWVALFGALAVTRVVEASLRGARRDFVWAGIWIGLGMSSKYTPVLLLPALFAAHALAAREGKQSLLASAIAAPPWLGVLAAGAAFAATSPYLILNLPVMLRDVGNQRIHMTEGHFGASRVPPAIEYLVSVLAPSLGWIGLSLALVGLAWACVRFRGPWLALAACILPYYVGLSLLKTQFPRYVLPLLMPIAVGLAGLVAVLREKPAFQTRGARLALAVVAALVLGPPALATWRYHVEKERPSAAHLANEMFLADSTLQRAHVASEMLGLSLPTARSFDALPAGMLRRLTVEQRQRLLSRPVFDVDLIPMYSVQPEMSAFYYDVRHYLDHDFVVVSQGIRDRYLMEPQRFAPQIAFYRDLDRHARLLRRFGPEEGARPPEVRVYQIPARTADALRRARGPIPLDLERIGRVSQTDFMIFVEGVARAALARGDWATAARYYRLMWENAPRAGMDPDQRQALANMVAQLEARLRAPAGR